MKEFFKVEKIETVLSWASSFPKVGTETIALHDSLSRVLAEEISSDVDIPGFNRSTMDGFAVNAASTFGASESNPAYMTVKDTVLMGETPSFSIGNSEAARISTGGMLPGGTDGVVMVEHTDVLDDQTIEVYKSVAPGQHMIKKGEDIAAGNALLKKGYKIRPQETGLMAASGRTNIAVYKKPVIGIISTGDEVVPVDQVPATGQIRDINSHTLAGQVIEAGGIPKLYGIVKDDFETLFETCKKALDASDMVLISGGSSVGARDFTVEVLHSLPDTQIMVHGISISPGKPTILARSGQKAFWGLPGQVVSAMVVFAVVVKPFIEHLSGLVYDPGKKQPLPAVLTRNLSSAQGRVDFVRVRLMEKDNTTYAEPVLGKSGLINTMVKANGLVRISENREGLDKGAMVSVIPL